MSVPSLVSPLVSGYALSHGDARKKRVWRSSIIDKELSTENESQRSGKGFRLAAILSLLVAIFIFLFYEQIGLDLFGRQGLSDAQFLALPLVLLSVILFRCSGFAIPVLLIAIVGTCSLASALQLYSHIGHRDDFIRVALFSNDEFEIDHSRFRRALDLSLARQSTDGHELPGVGSVQRQVEGFEEVTEILPKDSEVEFLIWGDTQWLNVFIPAALTEGVDSDLLPAQAQKGGGRKARASKVRRLKMVHDVPAFGLSYQPEGDTRRFLAALSSGKQLLMKGMESEAETLLLSAAEQGSLWSSFAHRAYPWFLLGNMHMRRAFAALKNSEKEFDIGELNCALDAFEQASGNLRFLDNPPLRSAVLNNLAMAKFSRFVREGHLPDLFQSTQLFKAAVRFGTRKNRFGFSNEAAQVANSNLRQVKKIKKRLRGKVRKQMKGQLKDKG